MILKNDIKRIQFYFSSMCFIRLFYGLGYITMPFTLSHPAVAAFLKPWFKRGHLSVTGIVIGSMAPDFEYFLHMKMLGEFGHTFFGVFLLDLPIAILVALLFHLYIRDVLIENLPYGLSRRFWGFRHKPWWNGTKQQSVVILISILIGILTHIVWDAFTHKTGFMVKQLPILQDVISISHYQIQVYKVLQHSSSLFGLALIGWIVYRLKVDSVQVAIAPFYKRCQYWLSISAILFLFLSIWALLNSALRFKLGHIVVAAIACSFWSVLFVSLLWRLRRQRVQ